MQQWSISFSKSQETNVFFPSYQSQGLRIEERSFPEAAEKKGKGRPHNTKPQDNAHYFFIADLLNIGQYCCI